MNVCDVGDIEQLIAHGDKPPPTAQGGGKRGVWEVRPDGSGTWTRHDNSATRLRTLYRSGPARHEVHTRDTFDAQTGQHLDTTRNFATAKIIDAELPSPRPRALRTVFSFDRTSSTIPPDAILAPDGEPAQQEDVLAGR